MTWSGELHTKGQEGLCFLATLCDLMNSPAPGCIRSSLQRTRLLCDPVLSLSHPEGSLHSSPDAHSSPAAGRGHPTPVPWNSAGTPELAGEL